MANVTVLICFLACIIGVSQCAKVLLLFTMASKSHHRLGESLSRVLLQHGFEVTMVTPYETKNPPENYTEVVLTGLEEKFKGSVKFNLFDLTNSPPFFGVFFMPSQFMALNENALSHPNFQAFLHSNQTFDVVIIEQFVNDGFKLLAHHYKAPLIVLSSMGSNVWISTFNGVPEPPSYLPDLFLSYGSKMTFVQRIKNFLMRILQTLVLHFRVYRPQRALMKKYFPNLPELDTILYNTSLVFLNSHESINHAMPYVPNMVNIGGYHVSPPKELPNDLKHFMDTAKDGVIYFSLGSNLVPSQMPPNIQKTILKILGSRKEKVLWKWDQEELENKPSNMMISKWFPQQDILAHPNLKLFITHCGLLSITETIYHGVPILGFPVFGDQKLNANQANILGFGKSIPFPEINEENLNQAINELLDNPKYRENAKYRSQVFHDRPVKPTDLVGYWVNYIIRHGGAPHLRVAGIDLPWYQYLMLDVVAVLFATVCLVLFVIVRLFKLCFRKKLPAKNKLKTK